MAKSLAFTTIKEIREQSEKVREELRRRSLEDQLKEAVARDKQQPEQP